MAKSKAVQSRGTTFSIGGATATVPDPTSAENNFKNVAEIKTIKQSGAEWKTEDVTNLGSDGEEFQTTIFSPGEWDISGQYSPADDGQTAMKAALTSGALTNFQMQLPAQSGYSKGEIWSFSALVLSLGPEVDISKTVAFSAKLKVSGLPTITAAVKAA